MMKPIKIGDKNFIFKLRNVSKVRNKNIDSLPGEIWKDTDYYGYQISNKGRVKSTFKNIIKSQQIINSGYYSVTFSVNGKSKGLLVHRLVAKAFIDNPNNLPEINHIDENKLNNAVENLEWVTGVENKLRSNIFRKGADAVSVPVIAINKFNENSIMHFNSIDEAARAFGVWSNSIKIVLDKPNRFCRHYKFIRNENPK